MSLLINMSLNTLAKIGRICLFCCFLPLGISAQSKSAPSRLSLSLHAVVVRDWPLFQQWLDKEGLSLAGAYEQAGIALLADQSAALPEKLKQCPQVLYYQFHRFQPEAEIPVPGHNLYTNRIPAAQHRYPDLDGHGQVVSIRELPFYFSDPDLKNRLIPSPKAAGDTTVHAALMATLVAGAGNTDPAGRGVAPACRLISSGYADFLPETDYNAQGVAVQNHAYGVEIDQAYGIFSRAYDVSARYQPHVLQVFSAGNKGTSAAPNGRYAQIDGFSNLSGNMKVAKNVLCVGATDSLGRITSFSARGPAGDGRVKPEMVAFGQDGTSSAAALVAGAAAVVQQALTIKTDTVPHAALVKTLLIQSAVDGGVNGPDFEFGFGQLHLQEALNLIESGQFDQRRLSPGTMTTQSLIVPPGTQQLKVSLVWDDPENMPGTPKALVNDLDLELMDPSGQIWMPWVLHSFPHPDSLRLPAIRAVDTLNNIEQVSLDQPMPGVWTIRVRASHSISDQTAFFAWQTKQADQFHWIFPQQGETALAGQTALLHWDTNLPDGLARLEWKPVGAASWVLLDSAVSLRAAPVRWTVPQLFVAAQVRLRAGTQTFVSDTFVIAERMRLQTAFVCEDSIGLFWQAWPGQPSYQLYGLGMFYQEPLFVTTDTFVVLSRALYTQTRFAVAPFVPGTPLLGDKSPSPDVRAEGVTCYIRRFLAIEGLDQSVDLELLIGATHGLQRIEIQKWRDGRFETLAGFEPPDRLMFQVVDTTTRPGVQRYRAVLWAENGGVIYSDTMAVYLAGDQGWFVFPNPIGYNSFVQVLYPEADGALWQLYDATGRLCLEQPIDEYPERIAVRALTPGFYVYRVVQDGVVVFQGKLIK